MNLKPGDDLASIDGSHDGVRTRASPKLIITPKRIELALRLALPPPPSPPLMGLRRQQRCAGTHQNKAEKERGKNEAPARDHRNLLQCQP